MSKETYNRSKHFIGILTLILLGRFMWNNALLHILSSVFLTAMLRARGSFTNKQYRLGRSISIQMASQPRGGTIHNKPTQCEFSQLHKTKGSRTKSPKDRIAQTSSPKQSGWLCLIYRRLYPTLLYVFRSILMGLRMKLIANLICIDVFRYNKAHLSCWTWYVVFLGVEGQ